MKTAFITGTSRGIGKATAEAFAKKGWNVITHTRKQTDNLKIGQSVCLHKTE